jgi:hypothetical protein
MSRRRTIAQCVIFTAGILLYDGDVLSARAGEDDAIKHKRHAMLLSGWVVLLSSRLCYAQHEQINSLLFENSDQFVKH